MGTKRDVLNSLVEVQVADAVTVAEEFSWTAAGASTMLWRYHRAGVLRRQRVEGGRAYEYEVSERGVAGLGWEGRKSCLT